MTEVNLSAQERTHLQDLMVRTSAARILRRAYALWWNAEGESFHDLADQLKVSRPTVYNWLERFHERADGDLRTRLADAQRSGRAKTALGSSDPLIETVSASDPRAQGYRAPVWSAPVLMNSLANVHHRTVACQSVRLAIARLRIRWKRPRPTLALRSATWHQAKGG